MAYHYRAFGLTIESELPFFDLPMVDGDAVDVSVILGETPEQLDQATYKGDYFVVAATEFLMSVDGVARFLVRQGREIIVQPCPASDRERILLYLLGSAMGALLHQRGMLPLHASAVKIGGRGIILAGPSGIGKSTLAAAFHRQRNPLLADDICALAVDEGRGPMVLPGLPQLKLWADALQMLGRSRDGLQRVRTEAARDKYLLPLIDRWSEPVPAQALVILQLHDRPGLELVLLKGMERVAALVGNTYRLAYVKSPDAVKQHFSLCSALSGRLPVYHLFRPATGVDPDRLRTFVQQRLSASSEPRTGEAG